MVSQSTSQGLCYRDLALRSLDQLPPFSPVLHHLLASLASDEVPVSQLADLLERDTVLAGNVLRMVNSAAYGRRGTINSVRHAVSILGLGRLRNFLLGVSISRLWAKVRAAPSWSMTRFNLHATATAVMADLLVQQAPVEYAEGAFAAGLLHDLGRLMIAVAAPDEHERILANYLANTTGWGQAELEQLDINHGEIGAAALLRWNLPVQIQEAVGGRHPGGAEILPPSGRIALGAMVATSSLLADHFGYSVYPEESERAPQPQALLAGFGLAEKQERLLASFQREYEGFRSGG
jgi:HD-like signal output (HDOD) protein